jgi:hypothetical protein
VTLVNGRSSEEWENNNNNNSNKKKEEILSPFCSPITGYWDRNPVVSSELIEVINGSFKVLNPPNIKGCGYVLKTLGAALVALKLHQ